MTQLLTEAEARVWVEDLATPEQMAKLDRFADALIAENQSQNLISKPSEAEIWLRHIADSAQLLRYVPRETSGAWLDLGTGAGFPGFILAILRPQMQFHLVESRARRVEWLSRMVAELDLSNCTIEGLRLELLEPFPSRVISARAFAPLDKLLRLSTPFSTAQTTFILPKGRSSTQEWEALPRRRRTMFHVEQSLTSDDAGIIVSANAPGTGKTE